MPATWPAAAAEWSEPRTPSGRILRRSWSKDPETATFWSASAIQTLCGKAMKDYKLDYKNNKGSKKDHPKRIKKAGTQTIYHYISVQAMYTENN